MPHEPVFDDPEFYSALGLVAFCSTRMFVAVESLILGMMSKSQGGVVLTVDLSYAQLSHLANALADRTIKGKVELATLTSILSDASKLYDERNKMIHGEWIKDGDVFVCRRMRARGKLTQLEDDFEIADMYGVAVKFQRCRQRLFQFMNRKRFLEHTMFDENAGQQRLKRRVLARRREQARIQAQQRKDGRK
jgi:hypothetical protein